MVLDTIQVTWIAALGLPITVIFAAVSCLFCFRKKNGFSNFSSNANTVGSNQGHHNTTFTLEIPDAVDEEGSNTVTVEPLPDISPRRGPLRPRIVSLDGTNQNSSLKLLAHHAIPRSHLTYLKELGSGWFGKAIESSAERLISGVPISTVVVKMLKDDASKAEQKLFIEEVAPFREIEHTNILRLLGECTEMNPMLMVLEASPYGDLKQYLRSHQQQRDQLLQKNRLIQFATDAACGLACLHRHDYLHRDLAARNCLVMGNHVVKIGDYGFAEEAYQEDYYRSSNHLLPIRWMAPETLKKEKEIWVASNFSKESDIWSLGVLLWEIAMLGERPYDMLTDKAVLQGVIVEKVIRLPEPEKGVPQRDKMYEVMRSCWLERGQRTKVDDLHSWLQQAAVQSASLPATTIPDFESKWMHLVPNQRHASLDSKDSHLTSFSSTDTDLLAEEILSSNSFDNLTELEPSTKVMPAPVQLKVSASELRTPVAGQLSQPNISATEDMKEAAKGSKEVAPAFVSQAVSAENVEFTDFTSYEWADVAATNEASLSQTTTKLLPTDLPVTAVSAGEDGVEEPLFKSTNVPAHEAMRPVPDIDVADLKVPSLSPLGSTEQSASYSLSETPFRPKTTPRKTSTPVVRESQSTVDSQASASAGSSFLTAMDSSQHTNTSDYYTTANNSTNSSEQSSGEMLSEVDSESSYACFEMRDKTTVGHNHAEDMGEFVSGISTAEVSAQSRTADSFFPADVSAQQMSEETKIGESKDDSFGEYTSPDMENMYAPEISADAELKIKNSLSTGDTADLFPSLFASVGTKPTAVDGAGDTLAFCSPEEKREDYRSVGNKAAISKLPENQADFNSEGDTSANGSQADVSSDFKSFGLDFSDFGSLTDGIISSDKLLQEPVLLGSPNVSPHFDYQEFSCATTTPEQADGVQSLMSLQADQVNETLSASTAGSSFTGREHLVSALADFESFSFTSYDAANLPDQGLIEDKSAKADTEADKSNSAAGTPSICADFLDSLAQIGDPQQHSQMSFQDETSSPLLDQSAVSLDENISLFHISENDKQATQPSEQPVVAFDLWSDFSFSSAGLQPPSEPFNSKGGMPLESDGAAAAAAVPDKVGQSLKVECQDDNVSGCESESSFLSTDSDSSDSDGIREYICREPWEKEPSASVSSNGDSEEYALQIASEIYLSKGLKMTRSFETPSLEPIPEDPLPSVSEESAPTPSETSSLDVRVEDVFEWDDFMGESLVGEEHTSDSSPKRSFDMLEWSMDTESDTFPSSTTSVFSQRSEDLRGSFGSDLHGTVLGKVGARSSHSDSEVTLYGRSQAHRLYLSELANRTKERRILPITSPIHSQDQSRFYSLFHDEFDLESDSMSEGSNGLGETHFSVESPSQSTAQGKVEVNPLHDETHLPSLLHDFDPSGSGLNTCPEDSKPGVTDGSQPPNPSLDLSALESADSGVTSTSDTDQMSTSTPGTDGASLIDF